MVIKDIEVINESENLFESKMVWSRRGKNLARKFRCTFGARKNRVVSNPSQCSKPINLKKRFTLRKTKAQKGLRMIRKSQKTKRLNPVSKKIQKLNKGK